MIRHFLIFFAAILLCLPVRAETKTLEFVPTSYDNLIKLYASFQAYDWDNTQVIDSYLRVTECSLFKEFSKNEFEWNKLRTASRDYIFKYKSAFPRRMEFIRPVNLESYDFNLGGFNVTQDNSIKPTTRLIVSSNNAGNISECAAEKLSVITMHFPLNMVLSFEKPFDLAFVPVTQALAEEYLAFLQTQKGLNRGERPAFVRIRFEAQRWQPILKDASDEFAHVYGDLISLDVFADKDLTLPLFSKKL